MLERDILIGQCSWLLWTCCNVRYFTGYSWLCQTYPNTDGSGYSESHRRKAFEESSSDRFLLWLNCRTGFILLCFEKTTAFFHREVYYSLRHTLSGSSPIESAGPRHGSRMRREVRRILRSEQLEHYLRSGSISGLWAARVCADHFEDVLIIEPEKWVAEESGRTPLYGDDGEKFTTDFHKRTRVMQYRSTHCPFDCISKLNHNIT